MGNLEIGNVCKSQVGCQEAMGEPGKSRGEPICSSLIVLEIISLHAMLGGESREVKCLCCGTGVQWAFPALEPLLPESRQSATGLERSCLREDTQRERMGEAVLGGHFWGMQGAAGGQRTH